MKIAARYTAVSALLLVLFCSFSSEEPLNMVDASGKRQGYWKITAGMARTEGYQPTQILQEGSYTDSKRIGVWTGYYADGTMKNNISYVDDKPDGPALYYSIDGKLACEVPYVKGVRSGTGKLYYPNGMVKMQMTWNTDRIDGPAKTYYPNGKVCEEGTWRHTYWVNEYKLYDQRGNLRVEELKPIYLLNE